jgi:hypothetical protein
MDDPVNGFPEAHFEELLAMLARHRDIADELTFFTHLNPTPPYVVATGPVQTALRPEPRRGAGGHQWRVRQHEPH